MDNLVDYFGPTGIFRPTVKPTENVSSTVYYNKEEDMYKNKTKKTEKDLTNPTETAEVVNKIMRCCVSCKAHINKPSSCKLTKKYVARKGTCDKWTEGK
jgi:hypothetical protein